MAWATLLLLGSCQNDLLWNETNETDPTDVPSAYVSVTISLPVQPRATTGALTGSGNREGTELGTREENKIENLSVFFYQGTLKGDVNTIEIAEAIHFGKAEYIKQDGDQYITVPRKVELEAGDYHLIVLANAGPLLSTRYDKGKGKLSDICNIVQAEAWKMENNTASAFVMSSKAEVTITIPEKTTEEHPVQPDQASQLARIAARVDVVPLGTADYRVSSAAGKELGVAVIKKVKLVNRLTKGAYLLKRVTVAGIVSGAPIYLGEETLNPKNYVLDPWTTMKTSGNLTNGSFNPVDYYATDSYRDMPGEQQRLGYTLENSAEKDQQLNGYSTGVIYQATFSPTTVIDAQGKEIKNTGGLISFCTYNDQIYQNAEALTKVTGILPADFTQRGVKTYTDGICYYPSWIRHSYETDAPMGVMEFAIVRNNVYQLKVLSISGLGNPDDTIDPQTPDKETYVKVQTSVRPWNLIQHPEIVM